MGQQWITLPKIDTGPSGFDSAVKGLEQGQKEYDRNTLFELGAKAIRGDWKGAQNTAFERGNPDAAFKIEDRQQAQADRGRDNEKKLAADAAGIFQNYIDKEADPARRGAMTSAFINSHPELSPRLKRYGVNVDDHNAVSGFFKAQAQGYQNPVEAEKDRLGNDLTRAQIGKLNRADGADADSPAARAALAQQLGYDPNSDAYKSFVMTGKLPREDQQMLTATDKKAIIESDEMVNVNRNAITALDEAKTLNPKANAGWLAGTRAALGNNLPDILVPDAISSPESSAATTQLDNAVVGNALTQLKAIFGGAPTEGERAILIELQGSSNQPANVRAQIFERAKAAAERRLQFNQRQADQLRGGTFYKPGGGSSGQPGAVQPPQTGQGGAPQRYYNRQTGQTIEWNGRQWVEVQ